MITKRRIVVIFRLVSGCCVPIGSTVIGIVGREIENFRSFRIRLGSSRLININSRRDRGVVIMKCRIIISFGFISDLPNSKIS